MWMLMFGHHEDCTPTHGYERAEVTVEQVVRERDQ
jgi:hypothetical protein